MPKRRRISDSVAKSVAHVEGKECNHASCGHRSIVRAPRRRAVPERVRTFTVTPKYRGRFTLVRLRGAYYGELNVPCYDYGNGNVALIARVPGMPNQPELTVMALDAAKNRLDPSRIQYVLQRLVTLPPTEVNVFMCRYYGSVIDQLNAKKTLTPIEKITLRAAIAYNNVVDIHFSTCNNLELLHDKMKINNVSNTNVVVSIHNVAGVDNAFFTGEYMVYGNGQTMFNPLGSIDISGHELGHGVVAMMTATPEAPSGMIYQGHSGAINESFADICGTMLEFWIAAKYNTNATKFDDVKVTPDFLLGEDIATDPLRNMEHPAAAKYPQPETYRGKYWVDPTPDTPESDFGGVHSNSGPSNRCFFLYANSVGIDAAFQTYMAALSTMGATPSYIDYRDKLIEAATAQGTQAAMTNALNSVGLTSDAVSDWSP